MFKINHHYDFPQRELLIQPILKLEQSKKIKKFSLPFIELTIQKT